MPELQEPRLGAEQLACHRDDDHVAVAHIAVGAVLRTRHILLDHGVGCQRPVEFQPFFGVNRVHRRARLFQGVDA